MIETGTIRYYCRVEACAEFTWQNIPASYCAMHLAGHLAGTRFAEKYVEPIGSTFEVRVSYMPPLSREPLESDID